MHENIAFQLSCKDVEIKKLKTASVVANTVMNTSKVCTLKKKYYLLPLVPNGTTFIENTF